MALGTSSGPARLALKVRHRRWLQRHFGLELAGGVARMGRRVPTTDLCCSKVVAAYGLNGDLSVGFTEWVALSVRGDMVWSEGGTGPATATYAGVRLGPIPTAAVTAVLAGFVILYITGGGVDS